MQAVPHVNQPVSKKEFTQIISLYCTVFLKSVESRFIIVVV